MRTQTTIRPDAPTTLDGLKAVYREEVEALIAKYPAQEQNRESYLANLEGAKIGCMTRRFASKGDFTVLPVGAIVLVVEREGGSVTVFAPSTKNLLNMSGMPATWVRMA